MPRPTQYIYTSNIGYSYNLTQYIISCLLGLLTSTALSSIPRLTFSALHEVGEHVGLGERLEGVRGVLSSGPGEPRHTHVVVEVRTDAGKVMNEGDLLSESICGVGNGQE